MLTDCCVQYDYTQVWSGSCDIDVQGKDRVAISRDQQQYSSMGTTVDEQVTTGDLFFIPFFGLTDEGTFYLRVIVMF